MALTIKQTSMTLSERFRILRAQALSREQSSLIVGTVTENGSVRGSARNQKLANQLATRPAVQAALRLKNRSIKQRLGIKASGRLGPPVSSYDNYGYGTSINDVASTRLSVHSTYLNHTPFQPKARFSGWRRLGPRNFRPFYQRHYPFMHRPNDESFKWINPKFGRRGFKKFNFTGNRRTRGRNPGGHRFWQSRLRPNKQQLDNDLDQYMAKTRSSLNLDLDAYMSQITE